MADEGVFHEAKDDDIELYPFAKSDDEKRRCFVFEFMANSDIGGDLLVKNMELVLNWLKTAEAPAAPVKTSASIALIRK